MSLIFLSASPSSMMRRARTPEIPFPTFPSPKKPSWYAGVAFLSPHESLDSGTDQAEKSEVGNHSPFKVALD